MYICLILGILLPLSHSHNDKNNKRRPICSWGLIKSSVEKLEIKMRISLLLEYSGNLRDISERIQHACYITKENNFRVFVTPSFNQTSLLKVIVSKRRGLCEIGHIILKPCHFDPEGFWY